ncbi:MAG: hypothetical protein L6Q99_10575 [Planctomycetes bacterium]|nr:hypothetical protein [Planctomycetota bacterium]
MLSVLLLACGAQSSLPANELESERTNAVACPTDCLRAPEFTRLAPVVIERAEPQELRGRMELAAPLETYLELRAPTPGSRAASEPAWQALADPRERVGVVWEPVAIHEHRPAELGRFEGAYVRLAGRLTWRAEDGRTRPFTWPVPALVVIAREPGVALDPTVEPTLDDVCFEPTVVDAHGRFVAHVDAAQIQRIPETHATFSVGFVLPALEPTSDYPGPHRVLAGAVHALDVPGAPAVPAELASIHASAGPFADDIDPAAYVRAVNELRALGEDGASARLAAYGRLARAADRHVALGPSLDHSDVRRVHLLSSLVFETSPGRTRPSFSIGLLRPDATFDRPAPDLHHPLLVLDGLPLLCGAWTEGRVGPPDVDVETLLEALRPVADVPQVLLVPTDDPLAAVDRVFPRLVTTRGSTNGNLAVDNDFRGQVWRALAPLVGPPPRPRNPGRSPRGVAEAPITGHEWRELKAQVRALGGVHWDASTQRYAAGPRK